MMLVVGRTGARAAALLGATALVGGLLVSHPAAAQDAATLSSIQAQITLLQTQLKQLQRQAAERDAELKRLRTEAAQANATAGKAMQQASAPPPAAPAPVANAGTPLLVGGGPPTGPLSMAGSSPQAITGTAVDEVNPTFRLGGVTVTLGGFVDLTGLYRTANETAGTPTNFKGTPFPISQNNHVGEFRMTAQQTRLSMLVQGRPTNDTSIAAYVEGDFNNGAGGANSNQTNSYTPRLRQAYAQYDDKTLGLHVLAGQAWSLATPNSVGLTPRKENIPLTIDTAYLPGFTYLRVPELRVTKDWGGKYWLGASLESPQASYGFTPTLTSGVTTLPPIGNQSVGGTVDFANPGGGGLNSQANYSVDIAPDVIVKAATDQPFGHFEAFGLGRVLQSRVSFVGSGSNKTALAGGVGGAAVIPVVKGKVELVGNVLAGSGVGRYLAGQLPDASFKQDGAPAPLQEVGGTVGLVGHPTKAIDLYGYAGMEQVGRSTFTATAGGKTTGYGYGTSFANVAGCSTELSSLSCNAQSRSLFEATVGGWWRFMQGSYGTVMAGAQYGYIENIAFHGTVSKGVGSKPTATNNLIYLAIRYLPFQ